MVRSSGLIARRARAVYLLAPDALEATIGSTCNFERVMTNSSSLAADAATAVPGTRLGPHLKKAQRANAKLLRRIDDALAKGDMPRAKGLQRRYITSRSGKLAAVARENARMAPSRRRASRELVGIAQNLNPWEASTEPVTANARDKSRLRFRVIIDFGLEQRSLQRVYRCAVLPFVTTDPRQYALKTGRQQAVQKILEAIDAGYKWCATLDISSFYPSISKQRRLNEIMPAPIGVTEAIIRLPEDIRPGRIGSAIGPLNLIRVAREGVSQGSSVSPVIAELIVKDILRAVPSHCVVVNYADDFAVMARSRREVEMISQTLISAARRSPYGRFQLMYKVPESPIRRVADGFDFLGYHFRYRCDERMCKPTTANEHRFFTKVLKPIRRVQRHRPNAVRELQRFIKAWSASFNADGSDRSFDWARLYAISVAAHSAQEALYAVIDAMKFDNSAICASPPKPPLETMCSRVDHWGPIFPSCSEPKTEIVRTAIIPWLANGRANVQRFLRPAVSPAHISPAATVPAAHRRWPIGTPLTERR